LLEIFRGLIGFFVSKSLPNAVKVIHALTVSLESLQIDGPGLGRERLGLRDKLCPDPPATGRPAAEASKADASAILPRPGQK